MIYLTVSELANALGVTPQGINKFMREQGLQSQAVKKGNKFLINETLAETIRNHFRPNDVDLLKRFYLSETNTETTETNTETTETQTETIRNEETAGQAAILAAKVEQLEIRLKEKDSEIEFLRNELKDSREIQKQLAAQNTVYTTKYLVDVSQESEQDSIIDVETEKVESETDIAETPKENTESPQIDSLDRLNKLTTWERIKFAFTGRLD